MFRDPKSHLEKILRVKAMLKHQVRSEITLKHLKCVVVITTAQLHSIKSEPKFCAGSSSAHHGSAV